MTDTQLEFHVFLAHNSQDKPQVREIAQQLKRRHLKPWLDEEQIPPGRPFQDEIQQAIPRVKSAAIFLGLQGLGSWQSWELRPLISLCVKKNIPVIPILLPGVSSLPEHLLFLEQFRWISFSEGIDDENALDLLEWGITGQKLTQLSNLTKKPGGVPISDDLSSNRNVDHTRLSGQQRKQLQSALIDAFPTTASLEQMLAYELEKNLRAIAGEGSLQEIVFKLIQTANAEGWVEDLVRAACDSNPGNQLLKAVAEGLWLNHDSNVPPTDKINVLLVSSTASDNEGGQLLKDSSEFVAPDKKILKGEKKTGQIPRTTQITMDRLKQDLEKLAKDYEDVANKKRRESNPQEINNLQLQLDDIHKQIEAIEQQLKRLGYE